MTVQDLPPPSPQLRPLGPIVRAEDAGIWHEASEGLAAARRHLDRVRRWALSAYTKERQRGYAEGHDAGAAEAARLIAGISAKEAAEKGSLEDALPALVMEIVEDLLGGFDPGDLLIRTVRQAVDRKYSSADLCLRVAPGNTDLLSREFATYDGRAGKPLVRVEGDPALSAEQCVLWSDFGNVDLSVAAQLRALRLGLGLPTGEPAR